LLKNDLCRRLEERLRTWAVETFGVDVPVFAQGTPKVALGDAAFAFPLKLAGRLKKRPLEIAEGAALILKEFPFVERTAVAPPGYLNVFFKRKTYINDLADYRPPSAVSRPASPAPSPVLSNAGEGVIPLPPREVNPRGATLSPNGYHPGLSQQVAGQAGHDVIPAIPHPPPPTPSPRPQVFLLDTVGELAYCYQFGRLSFVGGSLVPTGGHNIIEPALYKKCTVIGPHYENFKEIVRDFLEKKAVVVAPPDAFIQSVATLYADPGPYGERAHDVVQANLGSLERTLEALRLFLA